MTKRTSGLAALAAVACLLGLAGCGSSDPSPATLPPASSTPASPSATPSATVEAQVEAAVRHYFEVANRALATGDTAELKSLSTPGCGCRDLVKFIEDTYEHGRHPDNAEFVVESVQVHDVIRETAGALVTVDVPAYKDLNSEGEPVQTYSEHRGRQDLSLVHQNNEWTITNAVRLD